MEEETAEYEENQLNRAFIIDENTIEDQSLYTHPTSSNEFSLSASSISKKYPDSYWSSSDQSKDISMNGQISLEPKRTWMEAFSEESCNHNYYNSYSYSRIFILNENEETENSMLQWRKMNDQRVDYTSPAAFTSNQSKHQSTAIILELISECQSIEQKIKEKNAIQDHRKSTEKVIEKRKL